MLPLRNTCLHKLWYFLLLSSKILFKHSGRKRLFWRLSAILNARFKVFNSILDIVLQRLFTFFPIFLLFTSDSDCNWLIGWKEEKIMQAEKICWDSASLSQFSFSQIYYCYSKHDFSTRFCIFVDQLLNWFVLLFPLNHIYFQHGYAKENKCR